MSKSEINPAETASAINAALSLVARSALESALLAGSMRGALGAALTPVLADAAEKSIRDVTRLSQTLTLLDAVPDAEVAAPKVETRSPERALDRLLALEEETLQALVDAIPADADDSLGESVEHILEHAVMERAELIGRLRRARG